METGDVAHSDWWMKLLVKSRYVIDRSSTSNQLWNACVEAYPQKMKNADVALSDWLKKLLVMSYRMRARHVAVREAVKKARTKPCKNLGDYTSIDPEACLMRLEADGMA
ncbi:hypothetical protein Syun_025838 [Stephania yunnanensis]|uniref:Uncharacterized protein n=1 Tax=Stephania yunnanensis TaxID=152371 RepID=A0AAP0EXX0_9MAGN